MGRMAVTPQALPAHVTTEQGSAFQLTLHTRLAMTNNSSISYCRRKWLVIVCILSATTCSSVHAEDHFPTSPDYGRIIIMEENDKFASRNDRHYTQGARISYLSSAVAAKGAWDQPFGFLSDNLPIFSGDDRKRKYEWTIGQNIITPTNTLSISPSAKDRPYAAWLYTGVSLLQETKHDSHHTLENAEFLVGVVGPAALGGVTQNDFHQFVGVNSSLGWKSQIHNEPGFIVTYEYKWRFQQTLIGNLAVDIIPEFGASGGNILTYGEVGCVIRFGQNLAADYGPDRIRPSLSGTGWFDATQLNGNLGWYLFLGTQGRVVGQNIFLDGNTLRSSARVDKKPLVADFMAGASFFWSSRFRADFTITQRTKEFYGQQGRPDRFGGINFSFQL
jgi:lipid A 3-O-deacylase